MTDTRVIYEVPVHDAAGARIGSRCQYEIPAPGFVARFKSESEAIAALIAKVVPADAENVTVCTTADMPSNSRFRDAWATRGQGVVIDLALARMIHMDHIRRSRDFRLAEKDVEWMRAMGLHNQASADQVEAERQALRDLPQTFDLSTATTADELMALWPAGLPLVQK